MNIFQNISLTYLTYREFYKPKNWENVPLRSVINVIKWFGSDPVFNKFEPFKFGWDLEFSIMSDTDLTDVLLRNPMLQFFSPENNIQIGSDEGFICTSMLPPSSLDRCYWLYTFKSVKPNKFTFKKITI